MLAATSVQMAIRLCSSPLLAPILLVLLTLVARDESVMGPHRNGWFDSTFGFLAAGVMASAAIALVVVTFAR